VSRYTAVVRDVRSRMQRILHSFCIRHMHADACRARGGARERARARVYVRTRGSSRTIDERREKKAEGAGRERETE